MSRLYIIPEESNIEASLCLREAYNCSFEYNDFFAPDVLDSPQKQTEIIGRYRQTIHDFSNDILHGAFLDVTIHSSDKKIREVSELRIRQSMEIAEELGVRAVIVHSGRLYGFREENYIRQWLDTNECFFKKLLKEYPNRMIFMENMFDEAPDILAAFARRFQEEPRFGICLDYAHACVFGENADEWLEVLAPDIRHIHMNDNNLKEDQHLSIGSGSISWEKFTQKIRQQKIDAAVLVEVNGRNAQEESLEFMKRNHIYPF